MKEMLNYIIYGTVLSVTILCAIVVFALKLLVARAYNKQKKELGKSITVGFFHPYCNAGGGGERVLWCAIRAIQNRFPSAHCIVYTGDVKSSENEILQKSKRTFGISLPKNVQFVYLHRRNWVEASCYPILTLLGQSLGSMFLGFEALLLCPPDVFIDTMGYAFTLPIFKYIGRCKTGCYVHYPTISTDMLNVVGSRSKSFNNRPTIARSKVLTFIKLCYYRIFAYLYGVAGCCADTVMVNSSWTNGHISTLWKKDVHRVFPPCDISGFLQLSLENRYKNFSSQNIILSIGQFRPEKNHVLQVKAFHQFLSSLQDHKRCQYELVLVGGCRNKGDEGRVAELISLSEELGITESVKVKTNIPYEELKDLLSKAFVGIHTMANEHFGIGVVEFQAAGVLALAHDSGGPKMDIIEDTEDKCRTGFLASGVSSYADALREIFQLSTEERIKIAQNAREACKRFSESTFEEGFLNSVAVILSDKNQ